MGSVTASLSSSSKSCSRKSCLRVPRPLIWMKSVGEKIGPEEAEVEDVGAVVAGRHHADGDANARLAGLVGGQEVGGAEQIVIGEVDGELLGVGNLRGDLHGKVGLVLAGNIRSAISFRICASLAAWFWLTAKMIDLPISPLTGSRRAFSRNVLQKSWLVALAEEALLKFALLVRLLLIFARRRP